MILAPFASVSADRDAALVELMGDHRALTPHALAHADAPHNRGHVPSDSALRKLVVLELIGGAVPVVHDDLQGDDLNQLLHICRYLRRPVVSMGDLMPLLLTHGQLTQEHLDSINIVTAGAPMPEPAATTTMQTARTLGDRLRALKAHLLRWEQRANAFLGNILKNPMTVKHQQPPPRPYVLRTTPLDTTG